MDWSSKKTDRAVRSTYGAELLSRVKGVNLAFGLMYVFKEVLYKRPEHTRIDSIDWRCPPCPISSMVCSVSTHTDCRSLWDNLQSNRLPDERNLWPDVTFLKHLFAGSTIDSHYWTPTQDMIADALTKQGIDSSALVQVMHGYWNASSTWKEAKKPTSIMQYKTRG